MKFIARIRLHVSGERLPYSPGGAPMSFVKAFEIPRKLFGLIWNAARKR